MVRSDGVGDGQAADPGADDDAVEQRLAGPKFDVAVSVSGEIRRRGSDRALGDGASEAEAPESATAGGDAPGRRSDGGG